MYPFDKTMRRILTLIVVLCLAISIPLSMYPFVLLEEERLLTLVTTCLEVVVGFYGFLLAGYIFFMESLAIPEEQDELYCRLLAGYREWLRNLVVIAIAIVLMALAYISFGTLAFVPRPLRNYLVNLSSLMTVFLMVECLVFVQRMSDPTSLSRLANQMLGDYQSVEDKKDGMTVSEFLAKYNELENFLLWMSDLPSASRRRFPTMRDAVTALYQRGELSSEECDDLNRLKNYRNILVHGTDVSLDQEMAELLSRLRDYYEVQRFSEVHHNYESIDRQRPS